MNAIVKRGLELAESMTRQQQKAMFAKASHNVGTRHVLLADLNDMQGFQILKVPKGTEVEVTQTHPMGMRSVRPVNWKDWAVKLAHGRDPVALKDELRPIE